MSDVLKDNLNNIILALSNEHAFILQQVEIISNGLKKLDNRDFQNWLISIENTFMNTIRKHFKIEEKIIFPAALKAIPIPVIIDTVTILIKEHGIIEEKLECLFTFAKSDHNKNDKCYILLKNSLQNILEMNKNHAKIEVIDIFPKIANNPEACSIIEREYSKFITQI